MEMKTLEQRQYEGESMIHLSKLLDEFAAVKAENTAFREFVIDRVIWFLSNADRMKRIPFADAVIGRGICDEAFALLDGGK